MPIEDYPDLIRATGRDGRMVYQLVGHPEVELGGVELYNEWMATSPCVLWFDMARLILNRKLQQKREYNHAHIDNG